MGLLGWLKGGNRREDEMALPPAEPSPDPSRRGIELVAAGRYAEACEAFRLAIAREPRAATHHVNLAFALQECGEVAAAISHLKKATALDTASFDAHYMLGGALEQGGDLAAAAPALRRAVELQPGMEQAHADLIRVLANAGETEEACAFADDALARFSDSASLQMARGNLHIAANETEQALASFDKVLSARPGDKNARLNRALVLHGARRLGDALHEYDLVLAAYPQVPQAHAGRARTLKEQGNYAQAIAACRRAADIDPQEPEWLNLLGTLYQSSGDATAGIECFRKAVERRPDLPGGYANLGLALAETGDLGGAIAEYNKGLAVRPIAEMHDNLGIALQKIGILDGAIHHYREALRLRPDNLNTRCNLATALSDVGETSQAIAEYRMIIGQDPSNLDAHSNLLFTLSVYGNVSVEEYLKEAKRFDVKVTAGEPLGTRGRAPQHDGKPLRVGFVSGDFRRHPVGFFLEGILASLDRHRFALYAYSTILQEDALTARLRPLFSGWRSLKGLTTEQCVAAIGDDEVDVLFDLGGHTGENRLPVFAARAAPVQISWLGYFASTGVSAMDYVLADDVCVPLGSEDQFTEKVWRLPQTRLCFTPPDPETTPDVSRLPALDRGYVTFGSFQRLAKINANVLGAWGQILQAVPTARLYLQGPQTGRQLYVADLLTKLEAVGIEASRVTIRPPTSRSEYLRAHEQVDIILDTFPFNGGTTTCEALWMGVPTVTLEGDTMISRQGMSMMHAVGLPRWVGANAAAYVALAAAHAADLRALDELRGSLRDSVRKSPLFDVALFARRFSEAVEEIWSLGTDRLQA